MGGNPKVKYVSHAADVPKGEHWAILVNHSINIPGDERSRTNPGHGYPASTENSLEYRAYANEDVFKRALSELYQTDPRRTDIAALHVAGTVTPKIEVKFSES